MDTQTILSQVAAGQLSVEEAQQLMSQPKPTITYKVSPKGAVSIYGLRRMPITLYVQEIEKLTDLFSSADFQKFLQDNQSKLSRK